MEPACEYTFSSSFSSAAVQLIEERRVCLAVGAIKREIEDSVMSFQSFSNNFVLLAVRFFLSLLIQFSFFLLFLLSYHRFRHFARAITRQKKVEWVRSVGWKHLAAAAANIFAFALISLLLLALMCRSAFLDQFRFVVSIVLKNPISPLSDFLFQLLVVVIALAFGWGLFSNFLPPRAAIPVMERVWKIEDTLDSF